MNQTEQEALRLIKLGYPVFPIEPNSKRPLSELVPNGLKNATLSATIVKLWWQARPDANIAIETSGLAVVDIDMVDGGPNPWAETIDGLDTPMSAISPSGGTHLVFKDPSKSLGNSTSRLANKVDTRGCGGYIVTYPSFVEGRQYQWTAGPVHRDELPDLPDWLVEKLQEEKPQKKNDKPRQSTFRPAGVMDRAYKYLQAMGPAYANDGGGKKTFLAAQHLTRGFELSDSEAFELMAEWNRTCEPEWTDAELKHKIESARNDGSTVEWGEHLRDNGQPVDLSGILNGAPSYQDADAAERVFPHAKIIRMADVMPTTLEWLWNGIIPRGKLTMFTGDPGLGKSFLTLDISSRVSRGDCWPNDSTPTEQGAVILFAAEDDIADTIRPRLDKAAADVQHIFCIEGVTRYDTKTGEPTAWMFQVDRDLPILEAELKRLNELGENVRLIVIDPISCYLGKTDSHNNAEVRGTLAPLADLASRYQVAIVLVSHLNKSGTGKAVYRSSGSLAFAAAARSVWTVNRDLDDPKRRLLLPVKMNLCEEPGGLAYAIQDGRIAWEADPVEMTADEFLAKEQERAQAPKSSEDSSAFERAIDWLKEELADGRVESTTVKSGATANNISQATLRRAFNHLSARALKDGKKWFWTLSDEPASVS